LRRIWFSRQPDGVARVHRVELAIDHEADMAVDEPRQHGVAGAVDHLVAIQSCTDLDDASLVDHHVGHGRRRS
jgi:hypothetical protein